MTLSTAGFALTGRRIVHALTPGHRVRPARQASTRFSGEPARTRSRFSTLSMQQKDHPRNTQPGHFEAEHVVKTSPTSTKVSKATYNTPSPLSAIRELSFEHRLQFLAGHHKGRPTKHLPASLNTRSSVHTNDPSDPYTTASSGDDQTDQRRATRKKRYRPGFQPGDFICPQCGSHNHRPPEHNMASRLESKVLLKHNKAGSKSHLPSRIPVPGQRLSRYQTRIEEPDRKYPLGSTDRCFECGFGTAQEIARAQAPAVAFDGQEDTVMSETHEEQIRSSNSKSHVRGTSNSNSNNTASSDLRLSKPRDYVCPQCQTVNYNERLYCVGCGTLALGTREFIERGGSGKTRQSVKASSARTGKTLKSK
ncbi:unnamed protein product [Mortierella alpina]